MPFAMLKQSGHLRVESILSPDDLKAIGFADFERLEVLGPYSYDRAIAALPGTLVMLEKTSPRNLSAAVHAQGCTIIAPMKDRADTVFNGQTWSSSKIGIARHEIPVELYDPTPDLFAVIRFTADMQNRGWEETEGRLHLCAPFGEDLQRLQRTIRKILISSSSMPHLDYSVAAEALQEELIDALDQVLVSMKAQQSSSWSFDKNNRLVSRLDEFARCCPDKPLYSDALAKELGTSIRALQLAVREVRGMSLQRHLRSKRLWSLRSQLAKGSPSMSVSSAALANGFSHMGDLCRLYKATFGEVPSETLSRGRRS